MQLTLKPTDRIQTIEGTPCRLWEGTTEKGVPVHAYIRCVSPQTHDAEAIAVFDAELKALPPARREAVSFDMRFFVD
jgi:hypothetical protein